MLSIGPRRSVQVTKTSPSINVGDSSYLSVRGDGNNPKVILSRGKENGHLLLIESALGLPFTMVDNVNTHRTELGASSRKMKGADELLLVWSGTRWVEISFAKNS
jgi:hypothetical protein